MTDSTHSFYRTELRVLQNTSKDNEEFLTKVATLIGELSNKLDKTRVRAEMAEHLARVLENNN